MAASGSQNDKAVEGPAVGRAPRTHANKQCLSFPAPMLKEIEEEAERLDRSVSWIVQRAWKMALAELRKIDPT